MAHPQVRWRRASLVALLSLTTATLTAQAFTPPTVTWDTPAVEPSKDKTNRPIIGAGMPIGNGQTLGYVFKISPEDGPSPDTTFHLPVGVSFTVNMPEAMASDGSLFSLGMVSIDTVPSLFHQHDWRLYYTQTLNTSDASVTISTQTSTIKVWVDAQTNLITTSVQSKQPVGVRVRIQSLRPTDTRFQYPGNNLTTLQINATLPTSDPDALSHRNNAIRLSHRNVHQDKPAYFNDTLRQQGLGEYVDLLYAKGSDRWTNRQFGMQCSGPGLVVDTTTDPTEFSLISTALSTSFQLHVTTLAAQTRTADAFYTQLEMLHRSHTSLSMAAQQLMQDAHVKYWSSFWSRSYIAIQSTTTTTTTTTTNTNTNINNINTKYALTRYLQTIQVQGASNNGWVPIKVS